jgi:uncharacterized protein YjiS (DUF1127 family)
MNLFTHALHVWAQHREFHPVRAELDRYSDRQLRDMGLTRGDLTRVAYEEAERRVTTPDVSSGRGFAGARHSATPVSAS